MNSPDDTAEHTVLHKLLLLELRARRSERRWRLFRRLAGLLLLVALFWVLKPGTWSGTWSGTSVGQPHTAVIEIRGEIADDAEASARSIVPALRDALGDKNTRGLILRINSPGGSPVQAGIINDEIRRLRAVHDKPIYAVVEEACASGAYYIAAAADDIYVDKASIVGSIGALMSSFGFVDAMQKMGIERRLFIAGDDKGFGDPFSPMSEPQREHAQDLLDHVHRQFIEVVKRGRGDRIKDSPELFNGMFWTGEKAIALGLVDDYGSVDSVARDVVGAERLVDYTNRPSVVERVARRFGAAVGEGALRAMHVLPVLR
ncbi:MAG: S49 family peptidase [Ottowia sp.]|nr:S49 family peptidase [Ottowia sp.]